MGDQGAMAIASVLSLSHTLRELWVGNFHW